MMSPHRPQDSPVAVANLWLCLNPRICLYPGTPSKFPCSSSLQTSRGFLFERLISLLNPISAVHTLHTIPSVSLYRRHQSYICHNTAKYTCKAPALHRLSNSLSLLLLIFYCSAGAFHDSILAHRSNATDMDLPAVSWSLWSWSRRRRLTAPKVDRTVGGVLRWEGWGYES